MTLAAKRKLLHKYIDNANAKKVTSIFNLVEDDIEEIINPIDMKELYKRIEDHKSGKSKSYTYDEVFTILNKR